MIEFEGKKNSKVYCYYFGPFCKSKKSKFTM